MGGIIRPGDGQDKTVRVKVMFPPGDGHTAADPTPLPAAARTRSRWANGQGLTSEVAADAGRHPHWRVTVAEIPGDCDFSVLEGVDRHFMLLDPVELTLDLGRPRLCRQWQVVEFSGEAAPRCHCQGPAMALNLLTRRGMAEASLDQLEIEGPVDVAVPPGGVLVVVKLAGRPVWSGASAPATGDAVLVTSDLAYPDGDERGSTCLRLDGRGRVAVALIRILQKC